MHHPFLLSSNRMMDYKCFRVISNVVADLEPFSTTGIPSQWSAGHQMKSETAQNMLNHMPGLYECYTYKIYTEYDIIFGSLC